MFMHRERLPRLIQKKCQASIPTCVPAALILSALLTLSAGHTVRAQSHDSSFLANPTSAPAGTISQPCQMRQLPGGFNDVLMLNSNSPEVIKSEGILVSTFPKEGMQVPSAHLDQSLDGQFNLFAHHINNVQPGTEPRTLFIGALLNNPGNKKVKVKILKGASYVSVPDAPFIKLPKTIENPEGNIYAGPGDRVMTDILTGKRGSNCKSCIVLRPGQTKLLFNLPIGVKPSNQSSNGRSILLYMSTNGPVHAATLALFARSHLLDWERKPTLQEFISTLVTADVSTPRDKMPTAPAAPGTFIYGRVAGIQRGSTWRVVLTDSATRRPKLCIPNPGDSFAYPLSTVAHGTFGTLQIESAPLVVRYPDTAYQAHGNYGVEYDLTLPLYNDSKSPQNVTIRLDTPIKTDEKTDSLSFLDPIDTHIFFRGTIELKYHDDRGNSQHRYVHLVEHKGEKGDELVSLLFKPNMRRTVQVRLLYPPDATPPQVLTISTRKSPS